MGVGSSKLPLDHYTKEDIGAIVAAYGTNYEGYGRDIISNGIDGHLLASLSEDDFQEVLDDLGIVSRMHRRKLVHVFRSALACSSICSSSHATSASHATPVSAASAKITNKKRMMPRSSITSMSSFVSEGTISETDDYSVSNNAGFGVVFDLEDQDEHDQSHNSQISMIEEIQLLLDRQFEVNHALLKNVENLEEEASIRETRQKKSRPPQDRATIVLTDVENSTSLWEQNPLAMREAIELHDRIVRRTATEQFGYEIDTEGDAFHLAFHEASDAVAWALSFQEELQQANWSDEILQLTATDKRRRGLRVRVSLSVGKVESRSNVLTKRVEYRGPAWDFAKRIERMTKGGQILTTDETWKAAIRTLDMDRYEFPKVAYLGTHPQSWTGCTFDHILELAPAKLPLVHLDCGLLLDNGSSSVLRGNSRHFASSSGKSRIRRVVSASSRKVGGSSSSCSGGYLRQMARRSSVMVDAKSSPHRTRPRRKSLVVLKSLPLAELPDIDSGDESGGEKSSDGSLGGMSDHVSIVETGFAMF